VVLAISQASGKTTPGSIPLMDESIDRGSSIYQQWYSTHELSNYTQSDISWIGSFQIFLNFAGGLVAGPILDRFGYVVCSVPAASLTNKNYSNID
jgi:MFS family permease